ncbi:Hypothetical predicted protein [Mytilus galloprovincialis]|uniref:Uncharacterized protein n=1 Tax=Mytilus galloprovincialis TaxID=29158 RepID=A0A8B6D6U2_MYTGA|nr:Hypothetical predicted protein [Mytilus galloprovincialis]
MSSELARLDLPGSDEDKMFVDEVVNVTKIERNIKHPVQRTEVFMETDTDHPGFTRLRLIAAGKRKDAVTGWMFYASFYYVTGQYNVTLRLTEYALSKCLPDMLLIHKVNYTEADKDSYRHNVHYLMTLNDKMKTVVGDQVVYIQHSALIPQELELEVEYSEFIIPPFIMSHCPRFLCYHHIGDSYNRQQALCDLGVDQYLHRNVASNTFTLVGVCCEINGDKDAAFH